MKTETEMSYECGLGRSVHRTEYRYSTDEDFHIFAKVLQTTESKIFLDQGVFGEWVGFEKTV